MTTDRAVEDSRQERNKRNDQTKSWLGNFLDKRDLDDFVGDAGRGC